MTRKTLTHSIKKASDLYERFSGHEAETIGRFEKPVIPDVLVAIGEIDGIMYTTVRDGVTEKYIHRFKQSARPLLCSAPDGYPIVILGGEYDFTERGIVDRS
jgi:hypothetical protein